MGLFGKDKTSDQWFNEATQYLDIGNYKKSISCLEKSLKINPQNKEAWHNKGLAHQNKREYEESVRCYEKAIEIDENYVISWNNKGNALGDLGEYENSMKCFDEAIKIYPQYIDCLTNKGALLTKLGKHTEAIICFEEAIKINVQLSNKGLMPLDDYGHKPYNPQSMASVWNNYGHTLHQIAKDDDALKCFDKALKFEPNNILFQQNRLLALQGTHITNNGLNESDIKNNFSRATWKDAEFLVGKLFQKKGYNVQVTGKSGDFGIDVEASNGSEFIGIQVKHWSANVDFDAVAKTLGVSGKYSRVIIVSTKSGFSRQSIVFANRPENKIRLELWNANRFKQELRQYVLEN